MIFAIAHKRGLQRRCAAMDAHGDTVESARDLLEQFKQVFFDDSADVAACASALKQLKVCDHLLDHNRATFWSHVFRQVAVAKLPSLRPLQTQNVSPLELMIASTC